MSDAAETKLFDLVEKVAVMGPQLKRVDELATNTYTAMLEAFKQVQDDMKAMRADIDALKPKEGG